MINEPFHPEDFGFFHRKEMTDYPFDVIFYELDHASIDKTVENDWKRFNLFLSKSDAYICIWYGPLDIFVADIMYKEEYGFNLSAEQHMEYYFRGYITNKQEAEVIINALRLGKRTPQYLGG